MEKMPLKIIGNAPEEERKKEERTFLNALTEDARENASPEDKSDLEKNEIKKTAEQEKIFSFINEHTKEIQKKCGVVPYDIPTRNIFILREQKYNQIGEGRGKALMESQRIILKEAEHDYILASVSFHEMLHCKGKLVRELATSKNNNRRIKKNTLRSGLEVFSTIRQDENDLAHSHLKGVTEAVIAREQMLFNRQLLDYFPDVYQKFNSMEGQKEINEIAKKDKISTEEILWFDPKEKTFLRLGYYYQRKVLEYVYEQVASEMKMTIEDVHTEFLKSHLTGHLIKITRFVEKTFGKGSFRRLADMNAESNSPSAIQTLEALKKMKTRMK